MCISDLISGTSANIAKTQVKNFDHCCYGRHITNASVIGKLATGSPFGQRFNARKLPRL